MRNRGATFGWALPSGVLPFVTSPVVVTVVAAACVLMASATCAVSLYLKVRADRRADSADARAWFELIHSLEEDP